jgi:hypothetical protein
VIAAAGFNSVASAGPESAIALAWRDSDGRPRFTVGYIGEDGLEPNVAYRLDDQGRFVRVDGGAK